MNARNHLSDFLRTRRDRVQPEDVGLPRGTRRRVPGLRREEVAALAGISTEYYVQIERGQMGEASVEVLDAIAGALRLDADERQHLDDLAHAVSMRSRSRSGAGRTRATQPVPTAVRALLDSMTGAAALVHNGRLDIIGTNTLAAALFDACLHSPVQRGEHANMLRYLFLDDGSRDFYPEWSGVADDAVAMLHVEAGRAPNSRDLSALVGELATRSTEFATRWAAHDVRGHRRGTKRMEHHEVGTLHLQFAALDVDAGLTLYGYTPAEGHTHAAATRDKLSLLGSLASTSSKPSGVSSASVPARHETD